MNGIDFFRIIRENIWKIAVTTVIAMLVTAIVSYFFLPPVYEVHARILVNKSSGQGSVEYNDVLVSQKLANTYGEIIKSKRIARMVIEDLHLTISPQSLINKISVTNPKESQVITVSFTGENPEFVKQIGKKLVETFVQEIGGIIKIDNAIILDEIELDAPLQPIKPQKMFNVIIAGAGTLITSIIVAIFLEFLDPTVRVIGTARKILSCMVFSPIPYTALIDPSHKKRKKTKAQTIGQFNPYQDALRKVEAHLVSQLGMARRYMVSAPHKGMATRRVSYDLAYIFAESGEKTLYVILNGRPIVETADIFTEIYASSRVGSPVSSEPQWYEWECPIEELKPYFYATDNENLVLLFLSFENLGRDKIYNPAFLTYMFNALQKKFPTVIIASSVSMTEVSDSLTFTPFVDASLLLIEKGKTTIHDLREARYQFGDGEKVKMYGLFFDDTMLIPTFSFRSFFRKKKKKRKERPFLEDYNDKGDISL